MPDEKPPNNPAARLDALISAAWGSDTNALETWARVVGVPHDRRMEVFDHLKDLRRLPEESDRLFRALPDLPHDRMLVWVPPATNLILSSFANAGGMWSSYAQHFLPDHKEKLGLCGDILAMRAPEPTVDREDVADIHHDVWALREKIITSGALEPDVKDFLMRHVDSLDRALRTYRIRGVSALVEDVEVLAATVLTNPQPAWKAKLTEYGALFFKVIDKLNALAKFRENLPAWVAIVMHAFVAAQNLNVRDIEAIIREHLGNTDPPAQIEHYSRLLPPPDSKKGK